MRTHLFVLLLFLLTSPVFAEISYTLDEDYGNVPVTFVPNMGQFDSAVVFAAEGNNNGEYSKENAWESNAKTAFSLYPEPDPEDYYSEVNGEIFEHPGEPQYYLGDREYPVYLRLIDANLDYEVAFEDPASWCSNYFIGNDESQWHTDVQNYHTIRLKDVYPGIDITGTGNGRAIKFSLVIHPGADPSQIQFTCDYARYIFIETATRPKGTLTIDEKGDLIYSYTYSDGSDVYKYSRITQAAPWCSQGGQEIDLKYYFIDEGHRIVGFDIGEYDPTKELTIELPLVYMPGIATRNILEVTDIKIDDNGCTYLSGKAEYSYNMGALFALRLNETENELEFVTYFTGLSNIARISAIDFDSFNNVYLAGWAGNEDFPTTENAFDKVNADRGKAFVLKMTEKGNTLEYSTLLGGSEGRDWGAYSINELGDMYVTHEGNAYVCGFTISEDFPTTPNVFNNELTLDKTNGFITKLSATGSYLEFSTFFEIADLKSIQVVESGEIIVAGNYEDVIVGKLNYDASDTLFTHKFGGNQADIFSDDILTDMKVDNAGDIYVTGYTASEDFYTTDGSVYQGGTYDCFATKISNTGSLVWSKLIGGSGSDVAKGGICIDKSKNVYISGRTQSVDYPITPGAYQETKKYSNDTFLTILDTSGNEILYSSFLGANECYGMEIHNSDVIVFGHHSEEIPEVQNIIDVGDQYLLKFIQDGATSVSNEGPPSSFTVYPAYPNPFNPSVTLPYCLPDEGLVTVKVFNLQGQLIDTLVNEYQSVGIHRVIWNAEKYASGVYLYQISVGNNLKTGKLLLIK